MEITLGHTYRWYATTDRVGVDRGFAHGEELTEETVFAT